MSLYRQMQHYLEMALLTQQPGHQLQYNVYSLLLHDEGKDRAFGNYEFKLWIMGYGLWMECRVPSDEYFDFRFSLFDLRSSYLPFFFLNFHLGYHVFFQRSTKVINGINAELSKV